MQITAMDLTTIAGIIILLNDREVGVEVDDTFTTFNDQFIEENKKVVTFQTPRDSWFCPFDQVIELNEQGVGIVSLTEGDAWDTYGDVELSIKVEVLVPLTAEILLKKRIGIL